MIQEKNLVKGKSISNDVVILTYIHTISVANQPIFVFKDKDNKEVKLNKFDLKKYKLI